MNTPPAAPQQVDDIEDRDPSLARERTDLAWMRTAISFLALGAAMLRTEAVTGALVIVIAVVVWGLGQLAARVTQPASRRHGLSHRRTAQIITAATTVASLLALALVLLPPSTSIP